MDSTNDGRAGAGCQTPASGQGHPVSVPGAGSGQVRIAPPFTAHQRNAIRRALEHGRVMTYPTETSYALGGNALSAGLVDAIYRLKGRERCKRILLLVDGSGDLSPWVRDVPEAARVLMRILWPGPLTLVLRGGRDLPAHLADERGTVAVRWSPHPVVAELLAVGSVPLIGTSANRSGAPSLNDADSVLRTFRAAPLLAIDGGPARGGPPSTVLDATVSPFLIVREGALSRTRLRDALASSCPDAVPA
ncbi:MAG: L-threonylcarbamoyladenylate synthase [SAR324 cluster bacterium]